MSVPLAATVVPDRGPGGRAAGPTEVAANPAAQPACATSEALTAHTDRALLARFVETREEAAFRSLVERHGRLVLGTALRVLHDRHAAEDVFQAVFLVLARKAAGIRRRASLAGWLHCVALRIARRALGQRQRRAEEPLSREPLVETSPWEQVGSLWEQQVLDEELQRLPDSWREPLILHELEGRSCEEVAAALGLTLTAVEGRLKRGRKELRQRLLRHGIGVGAVLTTVQVLQASAVGAPSQCLIAQAVHAGVCSAASVTTTGTTSSQATQLAEQELIAMNTLKTSTMFAVAAALMLGGLLAADSSIRATVADNIEATLPRSLIGSMGAIGSVQPAFVGEPIAYFQEVAKVAEGEVTLVDMTLRSVWINRGSINGVLPQSTYSVMTKQNGGVGDELKARIEVVRVDRQSAECRVLEEDLTKPIAVGDPIVTLASDRERRLKIQRAEIETRFAKTYRLDEGEVLRHIPEPLDRGLRLQWYNAVFGNNEIETNGMNIVTLYLQWKDGKAQWKAASVGFSDGGQPIRNVLPLLDAGSLQDIEGDEELLAKKIPGDWVFDPKASAEQIVAAMEPALRKEWNIPVTLRYRDVERDVYVVRGEWAFKPISDDFPEVQIYGLYLKKDSGGGSDTDGFDKFLKAVGSWIEMPIIDRTIQPPQKRFSWRYHMPSPTTPQQQHDSHNPQYVTDNLAAQTGLEFVQERRTVRILFLEREADAN